MLLQATVTVAVGSQSSRFYVATCLKAVGPGTALIARQAVPAEKCIERCTNAPWICDAAVVARMYLGIINMLDPEVFTTALMCRENLLLLLLCCAGGVDG